VYCSSRRAPAGTSQAHNHGTVSGTADLAAFFELPSDAVFEATLNDESATDESARQLGQARLEPAGFPPFHFEIDFDRNLIDARHRYIVSARVLSVTGIDPIGSGSSGVGKAV